MEGSTLFFDCPVERHPLCVQLDGDGAVIDQSDGHVSSELPLSHCPSPVLPSDLRHHGVVQRLRLSSSHRLMEVRLVPFECGVESELRDEEEVEGEGGD